MKEYIFIKFERGGMEIYINEFFPCSQARFNKLFKVVREFAWLNNVQELIAQLELNFRKRISESEAAGKDQARKYLAAMQECSDCERMVESRKHPNGVPLKKEELKEIRERLKGAKRRAAIHKGNYKKKVRLIDGLKKNLNMLEQVG